MKINRREAGTGHVQAYHREDCFYESARLKLKGFDAASLYVVKAYDSQDTTLISGKERMEEGLLIVIPEQPGAATVAYSKALH